MPRPFKDMQTNDHRMARKPTASPKETGLNDFNVTSYNKNI